jgi:hypothetical protein
MGWRNFSKTAEKKSSSARAAGVEYFGTYLEYLPTDPRSQHSDTFPANPSWIPDIPQHHLLQNKYCFFLETPRISHASQLRLFKSYQNHI